MTTIQNSNLSERVKNALQNAGVETVEDLKTKTKKEIKSIKGLGELGFSELLLFCKKSKIKFSAPAKDPNFELKKYIVTKFLKTDIEISWGNEMRAAERLVKKYPEKDFWERFALQFKLNSLFFLFSERGKSMVDKVYYAPKQETIKIENVKQVGNEKVGEDIVTPRKSIRDFMND